MEFYNEYIVGLNVIFYMVGNMADDFGAQALTILKKMTLAEKIALQTGADMWFTAGFPRLSVPPFMMVDGPTGLRKVKGKETVAETCFPTASAVASSFDTAVAETVGREIAKQCKSEDVDVLLAPGVNIKRNPLSGRNFEYFSEDPFVAGRFGAAFINGVQSIGVGACVKHFACNNTEEGRMSVNSVVDERALREIYLKPFEYVVKTAHPTMLMSAYNMVNGEYCAENSHLLDVLENEWKYDGTVVTDWWANNDRIKGIKSGTHLEMPTGNTAVVNNAVSDGSLTERELDKCVIKILETTLKLHSAAKGKYSVDGQHDVAVKCAAKCAVLLKNDGVLPLSPDEKIAIIGWYAENPRYQGEGSSHVNAKNVVPLTKALTERKVSYGYAQGYGENGKRNVKLLRNAVKLAKSADKVIIVAGTVAYEECEGYNRSSLDLPRCQVELIEECAAVNKNVIVVLQNGAPVSMPFAKNAKGILLSGLAGEGTGEACADILLGDVNPSGRLAESYIKKLGDRPFTDRDGKRNVIYGESIYVGYRYYDKAKTELDFPFGYGLSYTDFEYSDVKLSANEVGKEGEITLSFTLTNCGNADGEEVSFAFFRAKDSKIFRPEKELCGFNKTFLKKGESKKADIKIKVADFAFYDADSEKWCVDGGSYDILLSKNADETITSLPFTVNGDVVSADKKNELPSYYFDNAKFNYNEKEFARLYGKTLPQERNKGEDFTVNSTMSEIAERPFGRFVNGAAKTAVRILKVISPKDAAAFSGTFPMLPIRALKTLSPNIDDGFTAYFTKLADKYEFGGVSRLVKALCRKK